MIDIYLRADTAEALRAACPWLWDEAAAEWIGDAPAFSLSVIGPIPPIFDEGEDDAPGDMLRAGDPAFHANLRVVDMGLVGLVPVDIIIAPEPESPLRAWA